MRLTMEWGPKEKVQQIDNVWSGGQGTIWQAPSDIMLQKYVFWSMIRWHNNIRSPLMMSFFTASYEMPKCMPTKTLLAYRSGPWHLSEVSLLIWQQRNIPWKHGIRLLSPQRGYEGPEHPHMNDSRKPLLPKPLFQENLLVNQHFFTYRHAIVSNWGQVVVWSLSNEFFPHWLGLRLLKEHVQINPQRFPLRQRFSQFNLPPYNPIFHMALCTSKFTNRIRAHVSVGIAELLCRCRGTLKFRSANGMRSSSCLLS